jgi:hypothetical protein
VEVPDGIFDFAEKILLLLHLPIISLDIATNGERFLLLEFQCLHFGPMTLENPSRYYVRRNSKWERIIDTSILEKEFVRTISTFLKSNDLFISS